MSKNDLSTLTWSKSSHSGWTKDGNCIEVALTPEAVAVRDSKDPDGPTLVVSPAAFTQFLRSGIDKPLLVRAGSQATASE